MLRDVGRFRRLGTLQSDLQSTCYIQATEVTYRLYQIGNSDQ